MNLARVQEKLGYSFKDEQWLIQALTHPSVDQKKSTNLHYERLEYLGDAVLELVVSRELFSLYPQASEGQLTQMRAAVVSRRHLAQLAKQLGWGAEVQLSSNLESQGGRESEAILANTFETIIGAVMMDSQYRAANKIALALLRESLIDIENTSAQINPKGVLLELLQAINNCHPTYRVEAQGVDGKGPFRAWVDWNGIELGTGQAESKRKAEAAAAAHALQEELWKAKH